LSYSIRVKEEAVNLRKKGYSIKEIAKQLGIAQSTSSLWVRDVLLSRKAQSRLKQRKIYGQYKASQFWKRKRKKIMHQSNQKALSSLAEIEFNLSVYKLLCSFLYWAEGGKSTNSYIDFNNSEPRMVSTFLTLLRKSFPIHEEKLRALIHIHEYHNEKEIREYWSGLTKIPKLQFTKSYRKPHTAKRIRPNYKGSIRIRYYDSKIALELRSIYNMFAKSIGA
jgi:transposase-like protein